MGGKKQGHHKKPNAFYEDKPKNYDDSFGIKLSMWYFDQCDPKKCSGMILKSRGLLTTLSQKAKFNGIVLTPKATKYVSPEDAEIIQQSGVAVIDCSWAFFDQVVVKSVKANERKLPLCKAANPVNYGKDIKLNCAEALGGALWLAGFHEQAETLMDEFKYGPAFFAINEFHFSKYIECKTSDEIAVAEQEVASMLEQEREERRNAEIDYGPQSSDEYEEGEEEEKEQAEGDDVEERKEGEKLAEQLDKLDMGHDKKQ